MFHKVLLLHGIHTEAGIFNWPHDLEGTWQLQNVPFRITPWIWGGLIFNWVHGSFTWIPWYRKKLVDHVLENIAKIPGNFTTTQGKLSIVAHSFGGTIVQRALEQGWHFHRLVLIATTMDEHFDWHQYSSQFEHVHIYWSPIDEVVVNSTYGRQGLTGPAITHPRVSQYQYALTHDQWFHWGSPHFFENLWKQNLL